MNRSYCVNGVKPNELRGIRRLVAFVAIQYKEPNEKQVSGSGWISYLRNVLHYFQDKGSRICFFFVISAWLSYYPASY